MAVSESSIDLENDLLQDESWDINDLNSPNRSLIPQEDKQQSTILNVMVDSIDGYFTSTEAPMDGFINQIITITVDDKHWIDRAKVRLCCSSIHSYNHYSHKNPLNKMIRSLSGK